MNISYSATDLYNKISSNGNSYISSYRKNVREADVNVQGLQEDIESFRKNIGKLKNFDSNKVTRSKLEKYLDDFAESYNELKDSGEKITDKELTEKLSNLEDFMKDNKKILKKLGLKESDGKWSFDSEALEETKDSDIDKLFEGNDAIFKQLDKMMRKVEKKADEEEYQTVLRSFQTVTKYSADDMKQGIASRFMILTVDNVQAGNSLVKDYDSTDDISEVMQGLDNFCDDYNDIVSNPTDAVKEYVDKMVKETKAFEEHLNNIGITIQAGQLNRTEGVVVDEAYKNSYAALFGEDAAYGTMIKMYAKNIFDKTFKIESLGITIDTYA